MNPQIDRRYFCQRLASGLVAALFLPKLVVLGWKSVRVVETLYRTEYQWISNRQMLVWWWTASQTKEWWMDHLPERIKFIGPDPEGVIKI